MTRPRRASLLDVAAEWQVTFFETGMIGLDVGLEQFSWTDDERAQTWSVLREAILDRWILAHPGSRPFYWWEVDAPKTQVLAPRRPAHLSMRAQRQRVGGVGDPVFLHLNYSADVAYGVPERWLESSQVSFYKTFLKGNFHGVAVNPSDPPTFESQASFLVRHKLLSPAEQSRFPVEATTPEAIEVPRAIRMLV